MIVRIFGKTVERKKSLRSGRSEEEETRAALEKTNMAINGETSFVSRLFFVFEEWTDTTLSFL